MKKVRKEEVSDEEGKEEVVNRMGEEKEKEGRGREQEDRWKKGVMEEAAEGGRTNK